MAACMNVVISCMCYVPEIMIIVFLMNSHKVLVLRFVEILPSGILTFQLN